MAFRNVAIIAHVDHGKTTLVDALLKQSGTIKDDEKTGKLVMDNNDQEKERGITIYSKNTAIEYNGNKINIIDTPGHADFGSEVERVLRMIDSVLLIVDAYEGPMPQTKFVTKKALELGLKPIVVINKIDKPSARPDWVIDQIFDLFVQLGANDEQLDFDIIYAVARDGIAVKHLEDEKKDLTPLFDLIIEKVPVATGDPTKPARMQIANLGYDNYFGRLGIGRLYEGTLKPGQTVEIIGNDGKTRKGKLSKVFSTLGLQRVQVEEGVAGDVITIAGIDDIFVGETIGDSGVEAMPAITIDEPTLTMEFVVNDSPFAGREGKFVTSRNIKERLEKELETNVGLRVEFSGTTTFEVSGRGELHLGVLIESMRREGFELQVGAPQVIFKKDEHGRKLEPIESVTINLPDDAAGTIIDYLGKRKGIMKNMFSENGLTNLEFEVPTRGLLGFKNVFMLETKGQGIMYHSFSHYDSFKGDINKREVGSMISSDTGKALTYSIFKLQDRGPFFVDPATEVYEGMIVGEHLKGGDLVVNLSRNKQLNNVRESGNDEQMRLAPIIHMSLEDALDYIKEDEYVEITPKNIRLRKKYLTESARKTASRKGI